MILELMQHRYLAEASEQLAQRMLQFNSNAAMGDAEVMRLLADSQVDTAMLRPTLDWVKQAAAVLALPAPAEAAYFPRDPMVSQVQSLLQRYFIEHGLTETRSAAGAIPVAHPVSDVSLCAAMLGQPSKQLFNRMSQSDIGWLACWAAKAFTMFGRPRRFPDTPAPPKVIGADSRLYLIGDWGSGVSRARKIAQRVRAMIAAEPGREQHVIHLGDVYYSGWPEEYDDHFLQFWPVRPGEEHRCGSWSLNSNHDMFSRGSGYFDHLLKDVRFNDQGERSFFSLETDFWQFLGLDSAFDDEALAGDQAGWVAARQRQHPHKKLVLLSHHQPFSAFENDCPSLLGLLANNTVTGWFWGHEHRFAVYKPRPDLKYGRLIGHGGVPVWARSATTPTPDTVTYVSTRGFRSGIERFALFGFAVLDLDGPRIRARYFDEYGDTEWTEILA